MSPILTATLACPKIGSCEEEQTYYDQKIYPNNEADLSDWAYRYYQRWMPNPNEKIHNHFPNGFTDYNFFCRPEGSVLGMETRWWHGYGFKCVNALGYRSQEPSGTLHALFHLEDGDDTAVGYPSSPNYFVVGNGRKKFRGGVLNDVFEIGGSPSGFLNGGRGNDTLRLADEWRRGSLVTIQVINGVQYLGLDCLHQHCTTLDSFETIVGRQDGTDHIMASCQNHFIDGKGGTNNSPDHIRIGTYACSSTQVSPLRISVRPATTITNENANPGKYYYDVLKHGSGTWWTRKIDIKPGHASSEHFIFLQWSLREFSSIQYSNSNRKRHFDILAPGLHAILSVDNSTTSSIVTDDEAEFSFMENAGGALFFRFNLENSARESIFGATEYPNHFYIRNTYHAITGGAKEDTFIFQANAAVALADATSAGFNTIVLDRECRGKCTVDLKSKQISFNTEEADTRLLGTFNQIMGQKEWAEKVIADCNVVSIDLGGSSKGNQVDEIQIPPDACPSKDILVRVHPYTHVKSSRKSGNCMFFIVHDKSRGRSLRTIDIDNQDTAPYHFVHFEHGFDDLASVSFGEPSNRAELRATAEDLDLRVRFHNSENMKRMFFSLKNDVEIIFIPSESSSVSSFQPAFKFTMIEDLGARVRGRSDFPNIFVFPNTSSYQFELVQGGRKSDTFIFSGKSLVKRVHGGVGGQNSIQFDNSLIGDVTVDMPIMKFGALASTTVIQGDFAHIIGRVHGSEHVTTDCHTQVVNLKSELTNEVRIFGFPQDTIKIPTKSCPSQKLAIQVQPFTHVTSSPLQGQYLYTIPAFLAHQVRTQLIEIHVHNPSPTLVHVLFCEVGVNAFTIVTYDPRILTLMAKTSYFHVKIRFAQQPAGTPNLQINLKNHALLILAPDPNMRRRGNHGSQLTPAFQFHLDSTVKENIAGHKSRPNYFYILAELSSRHEISLVSGGSESDTFIFQGSQKVKRIDSGLTGENLIELAEELMGETIIDMKNRIIQFPGRGRETVIDGKVQHFVGRPCKADQLIANCETETVDFRGGQSEARMDVILIPDLNCWAEKHRMDVKVHPFTQVRNNASEQPTEFVYQISRIPLSSENVSSSGTLTNLHQKGRRWIAIAKRGFAKHFIQFDREPEEFSEVFFDVPNRRLSAKSHDLNMVVVLPEGYYDAPIFFKVNDYVEIILLQHDPHKILPVFSFNMESASKPDILGGKHNPNRFQIHNSFNAIRGGAMDDVFFFGAEAQVKTVDGAGGENIIVLQPTSNERAPTKFIVDLSSNFISFEFDNLHRNFETQLMGKFTHLYSQTTASHTVVVGCSTRHIDFGNTNVSAGAENLKKNHIKVPRQESCSYNLTLTLFPKPEQQEVFNEATDGYFMYLVPSAEGDYVIHNVPESTEDGAPDPGLRQIFKLRTNMFEIAEIAVNDVAPSVVLYFANGIKSQFTIIQQDKKGETSTTEGNRSIRESFLHGRRRRNSSVHSYADLDLEIVANASNELSSYYDLLEDENSTSINRAWRRILSFPFYFLTADSYEITVNHLGGIHAVRTFAQGELSEWDLIVNHTDIANDLGMTVLLSIVSTSGEISSFIQIGGDDENDIFFNQKTANSHLVGNSMGSRNTFYVMPTQGNVRVYVYLPMPATFLDPTDDSEDAEIFEEDLHESVNIIDLTSFYDRRPEEMSPNDYRPRIFVPTVKEDDDDLVITARFISFESQEATEVDNPEMQEQEIIFVGGVFSSGRIYVKLYAALYEFRYLGNNQDNQSRTGDTSLWRLLPRQLDFEAEDKEEDPMENSGDESQENSNDIQTRSKRSAEEEPQNEMNPSSSKSGGKRNPVEHMIIFTNGDLVEYELSDIAIEIPPLQEGLNEHAFSSGDSVIITNNLPKPGFKEYFGYNEQPVERRTIILTGMRNSLEKYNATVTLSVTLEGEGKARHEYLVIGNDNFTKILPDLKEFEAALDSFNWWVTATIIFAGVLVFAVLLGVIFICWRYFQRKKSTEEGNEARKDKLVSSRVGELSDCLDHCEIEPMLP